MLTLEEQLLFLEEHKKLFVELLEQFQEQFGEINKDVFTKQIDHNNFCYDSVLVSLQELQNLKNKPYGK